MKKRMLYLSLLMLLILSASLLAQNLRISQNHRYIEFPDGKPFLYLGDTAWELFHRLNREEADFYLKNRAEKGFTVIQAVVLAELDGLNTPNAYGDRPLIDNDPAKPNEKYFEHVDYVVNKAAELGLSIGMLPTWGDKVTDIHGGAGPVIFNPENAATYGRFLGERYKNKSLIWILGGDRNIADEQELNVWRAIAKGIEAGNNGTQLISYHPRGGSCSAYWLHNEDWLDFNMYQSGHGSHYVPVYEYAEDMMLLQPRKPFVDGEPAYEDIAVKFWEFLDWTDPKKGADAVLDKDGLIVDKTHFKKGFITAHSVRVHAYWNFLSGACGYTYGNNAIWQMFKPGGPIVIPTLSDWRGALDRPGSQSIQFVKQIFTEYPLSKLVPDQSIIFGMNQKDSTHIRAAASNDGSFALIYSSVGQPVTVVLKKIAGTNAAAQWFNPRNGKTIPIGTFETEGLQTFVPPSSGKDNDWLLILERFHKGTP